jgi:hypothetical protein
VKKNNNASVKKYNASAKKIDIATNGELERLYCPSFSMLAMPASI